MARLLYKELSQERRKQFHFRKIKFWWLQIGKLKLDNMVPKKAKQLLVEGVDDKAAVLGLVKHFISWPDQRSEWPVFMDAVGSVDEILNRVYFDTKIQESGLEVLGIMVDADDRPLSRWEAVRSLCKHVFPDVPATLPIDGLIPDSPELRFGFWMMPDCSSEGMLENFLRLLVPSASESIWEHAIDAFAKARALGAPCREAHVPKAQIHTWLAWQDPPGERFGTALTKKIFDAKSPIAESFLKWFRSLYKL
jgi:hypothetical protein